MTTFKTAAMVSTLIYVALPLSASANPDVMDTKPVVSASVSTSLTQQEPARIVKERLVREVVLSSASVVSTVDRYRVQNSEGETFINHTLTPDELSPVTTSIQFNGSYEFEQNGKVYQNRTVR